MNGTQFEFLILKHKTHHPHYDLILQTGDGLKSWILLKEPPASEKEMRLAIEDEPHADFSFPADVLEDGYGTGEAEIWDRGIYKIKERNRFKIIFDAEGKRFFGKFIILLPEWGRQSRKRLWVLTRY